MLQIKEALKLGPLLFINSLLAAHTQSKNYAIIRIVIIYKTGIRLKICNLYLN